MRVVGLLGVELLRIVFRIPENTWLSVKSSFSHLFKEVYSLFKSRIIRFRKLGRGGLIATELEQIKKPEKEAC